MKGTERRMQLPPRERRATFAPGTVDEAERTVELVWTASAEVERFPLFDEPFLEVLPLESARLDRLNAGAPLLDAHRRDTVRSVLGHVVRAWREGPLGRAVVKFSDRPEAEVVFRDVLAGHVRAVSFAARIDRARREPPTERGGLPRMIATSWTPVEISLCPVGADPGATVRNAPPMHECIIEETMTEPTQATETEHAHETDRAETERQATIRTTTDAAVRIAPSLAPVLRAIGDLAVSERLSVDRARTLLQERLFAESERVPTRSTNASITADYDSVPSLIERMGDALAARAGAIEATDASREFMHRPLVDLCRELLEARHVRGARTMGPGEVLRSMHTTSDFPLLLADATNKMLRPAYESAPSGVRSIVKQAEAQDYKDQKRLQLGELSLAKVNEAGEVTSTTTGEMQEKYRVSDFARIIALSNQAIVNDDLQAFGQLVARFGWAAAEKERDELVALLALNSGAGPTMSDGSALFHTANHGNLGSGAIAIAGLSAGVAALRKQKGISGVPIGVEPRHLLVPAALEMVARQNLAAINPAQASNANPWAGIFELVVDPRLDALSATRWYLFADAAQLDTIELAFLAGSPGPRVETREGWTTLGAEVRCVHTFGVGAIDWRGCYASTGV